MTRKPLPYLIALLVGFAIALQLWPGVLHIHPVITVIVVTVVTIVVIASAILLIKEFME